MTPNHPPVDCDRIYAAPVLRDSTGREVIPDSAFFVGSRNAYMERILDSRQRRESLRLVNERDHFREEKRALAAMRADVAARADAVIEAEPLIRQVMDENKALKAENAALKEELAELKAEQEAKVKALPAFYEDEGELEVEKDPHSSKSEPAPDDDDDDLDMGVLPRAIIGPSSRPDPDLPPHPTLEE